MLAPDIETEQMDEPAMGPEEFVQMAVQSQNLVPELDDDDLRKIASQVLDDYKMDRESMSDWLDRMEKGLELAKLVKGEVKEYPFKHAANIRYPLITSAALQFNARAYPAIVPADQPVRVQVFGEDSQGIKAARAERISAHMSWQLLSQMDEWEEGTDSLLTVLPIVGTMVRKVWYDPAEQRPKTRLLEAGKFIVNDKVRSLAEAPRASEEIDLYPDEIARRERSSQFAENDWENTDKDKFAAQRFIEQHTRLDLDGDGYDEPYIVTVHEESQKVVRIVADFEPDDVQFETEMVQIMQPVVQPDPYTGAPTVVGERPAQKEVAVGIIGINRNSYFVPYHFLPALDGGFWGTGLGLLLGDISETINTIMNMMLDAGHYSSLGGGWIGQEMRLKGGAQRFRPGEWKMIPSRGGDIRQAIVPMTFPGPDQTLFQMLGMLIESGRELASVKDVMTGDSGGQNLAPTTMMALIEQGMKVFTAAYKRIFRSLKKEYALIARINAETVTPEEYSAFHDVMQDGQLVSVDPAEDYDLSDMDIRPVADPNSVTKMQQAAKAQMVMQLAQAGMVNPQEAAKRILEAADIGETAELVPEQDPQMQQMQQMMQMQMQQMQMQAMQADLTQKLADIEKTMAEVEETKTDAIKNLAEAEAEQVKLRFDGVRTLLEAQKNDIEELIARGRLGMARPSGNAGNAQGGGGSAQGPQGAGLGPVLGGQPGAGSGTGGFDGAGGVQGGLL